MQQCSENSDNEKKPKILIFSSFFKLLHLHLFHQVLRKALQNFLNYPPKQLKGT